MAFLFIATLLLIATAALLLLPLKHQPGKKRWTVAIIIILLVGGAAVLYAKLGYWRAVMPLPETTESASAATMVEQLAARLVREPDNLQGWALLGRSYLVLGDYAKAERSLAHALTINQQAGNPPNADLLSSYAEVLVLMNQGQVTPRASAIFEKVLSLSPDNPRALLFTGLAAFSQQNYAVAEARLAKVMTLQPPESIRAIITPRLQQARAALGNKLGNNLGNNNVDQAEQAVQSKANALTVSVRVANALKASVNGQGMLFIYARSPQGGPPLAVERHSIADLPLTVTLDASDAMLPSRKVDTETAMVIGARISRSGQALPQSGDLQGETRFNPGNATDIELVIDSVIP